MAQGGSTGRIGTMLISTSATFPDNHRRFATHADEDRPGGQWRRGGMAGDSRGPATLRTPEHRFVAGRGAVGPHSRFELTLDLASRHASGSFEGWPEADG